MGRLPSQPHQLCTLHQVSPGVVPPAICMKRKDPGFPETCTHQLVSDAIFIPEHLTHTVGLLPTPLRTNHACEARSIARVQLIIVHSSGACCACSAPCLGHETLWPQQKLTCHRSNAYCNVLAQRQGAISIGCPAPAGASCLLSTPAVCGCVGQGKQSCHS